MREVRDEQGLVICHNKQGSTSSILLGGEVFFSEFFIRGRGLGRVPANCAVWFV